MGDLREGQTWLWSGVCSLPEKGKKLLVGWNRDWEGRRDGRCSCSWEPSLDLCQRVETGGDGRAALQDRPLGANGREMRVSAMMEIWARPQQG